MGFGTFVFFGLVCIIGAAFVYFVVPETKGRTLEEMDEIFGDEAGQAREDRARLNTIYRTLGLSSETDLDYEKRVGEKREDPVMARMLNEANVKSAGGVGGIGTGLGKHV